jgi:hypothetical protein
MKPMQTMRNSVLGVATAGTLLCGAISALADGPMVLTNGQLDRITAGAAVVVSSTDAQAAGVLALVNTTSNSLVAGGTSPFKGQPGLTNTAGAADGTAVAVGTNVGLQGQPPPSSSTSVTTAGAAEGNLVINSTFNQTIHGAGGVTAQVGWTFVSGSWVGL